MSLFFLSIQQPRVFLVNRRATELVLFFTLSDSNGVFFPPQRQDNAESYEKYIQNATMDLANISTALLISELMADNSKL